MDTHTNVFEHEGHIEGHDVHLHYYRSGGDKPQLLFLHGTTDAGFCWSTTARDFVADFECIALDARGHGYSDACEIGNDVSSKTNDCLKLIQELKLQRIMVVGHSMGALVAAEAAARCPGIFEKAVLEDPPWYAHQQVQWRSWMQQRDKMLEELTKTQQLSLEELVALGKKRFPKWIQEDIEHWARAKQLMRPSILANIPPPDWRNTLRHIQCPVLIFAGNEQLGGHLCAEVISEIKQISQNAKVISVHDCGHEIHREKRQFFSQAVCDFLLSPSSESTSSKGSPK